MGSTLELHTEELYRVSSWREQIAVRFVRYGLIEIDPVECWTLACCEDEENQEMCDHSSDMCWIYTEQEPEQDFSIAVVVMVGDNREHTVDAADLIPLNAEQVCSCGQIGCFAEVTR